LPNLGATGTYTLIVTNNGTNATCAIGTTCTNYVATTPTATVTSAVTVSGSSTFSVTGTGLSTADTLVLELLD